MFVFFFCMVLNLSSTLHKSSVIQLSQTSQKHLLTLTLMNVPRFCNAGLFLMRAHFCERANWLYKRKTGIHWEKCVTLKFHYCIMWPHVNNRRKMYRIEKCKWNQSNLITVWWYCPPIWFVHVKLVPCQHEIFASSGWCLASICHYSLWFTSENLNCECVTLSTELNCLFISLY